MARCISLTCRPHSISRASARPPSRRRRGVVTAIESPVRRGAQPHTCNERPTARRFAAAIWRYRREVQAQETGKTAGIGQRRPGVKDRRHQLQPRARRGGPAAPILHHPAGTRRRKEAGRDQGPFCACHVRRRFRRRRADTFHSNAHRSQLWRGRGSSPPLWRSWRARVPSTPCAPLRHIRRHRPRLDSCQCR